MAFDLIRDGYRRSGIYAGRIRRKTVGDIQGRGYPRSGRQLHDRDAGPKVPSSIVRDYCNERCELQFEVDAFGGRRKRECAPVSLRELARNGEAVTMSSRPRLL